MVAKRTGDPPRFDRLTQFHHALSNCNDKDHEPGTGPWAPGSYVHTCPKCGATVSFYIRSLGYLHQAQITSREAPEVHRKGSDGRIIVDDRIPDGRVIADDRKV